MADAQKEFNTFHSSILLDADSNDMLREKREILLKDLKNNIDEKAPAYSTFHQGSYELSTGVIPLEGDPDMDIGIIFDCTPEEYEDPVVLKNYVGKAFNRINRTVRVRKPCVTVEYWSGELRTMHMDLAIYSINDAGQTQLARGRDIDTLGSEFRCWEPSEAKELNKKIINAFSGNDRDQWRRVVRSLKRWRDEKIGHKNIPSIALTIAAVNHFLPVYSLVDGTPRDLIATRNLVDSLLAQWVGDRLSVMLPTAPFVDLLKNVTDIQMEVFKEKLIQLRDVLNEADKQADTHEACKLLSKQFGVVFPVPEKAATTKKTENALQPSGRSA